MERGNDFTEVDREEILTRGSPLPPLATCPSQCEEESVEQHVSGIVNHNHHNRQNGWSLSFGHTLIMAAPALRHPQRSVRQPALRNARKVRFVLFSLPLLFAGIDDVLTGAVVVLPRQFESKSEGRPMMRKGEKIKRRKPALYSLMSRPWP